MNKITISRPKGKGWDMRQGAKSTGTLTLGEVLEQLTHFHYHGTPLYPMETPKQRKAKRDRWRKSGKRMQKKINPPTKEK